MNTEMLMQSVCLRTPRGDRKSTDPEAGRRRSGGRDDWSVVRVSALWSLRHLWAARGRSSAGGRCKTHSCFLNCVALLFSFASASSSVVRSSGYNRNG